MNHFKIRIVNLIPISFSITILSYYQSQVAELEKIFQKSEYLERRIRISTVDSCQGSEDSIIIVSFVRYNRACKIGFLNENQRMNVASTRAKDALIFVGHLHFLSQFSDGNSMLKSYINFAFHEGIVYSYDMQSDQISDS